MPAYAVVNVATVTDPDTFAEYRRLVVENVERHGGRYIVGGGELEVLEGDWRPNRLVVIEFPAYEAARSWYDADDYRPLRDMRLRSSVCDFLVVDGLQ